MSDSRIFIGLSGSRDWSHGESHGPDRPMPAAILENFYCEQPCYGFLGLLKFLCFQTLPNLVNCFLIIFSLVWHPKDFAQIKITHGKNASNPSNRSAIVKSFSLCLTIPPLNTPWQSSELCALDTLEYLLIKSIKKVWEILFFWGEKTLNPAHFATCPPSVFRHYRQANFALSGPKFRAGGPKFCTGPIICTSSKFCLVLDLYSTMLY